MTVSPSVSTTIAAACVHDDSDCGITLSPVTE
jgi:hypothetical protein